MESVKRYNKDVKFVVLSKNELNIRGAETYTVVPHSHLFKFKEHDRMQEGVYYKFYLPLLPYKKILYMDCDTICQRPLNELWDMPCKFINATESHNYGKVQAMELGLKKYAISGMMLMNLDELRKADFTNKCLDYVSKATTVHWHDETVINVLFNDRIKFIDKKWNYCKNRIYDDPIPESDAYILHYVSLRNKREMLKLNDFELLQLLKDRCVGKRIAIVGNASSLLEKNQGEEIDGHDIVIRFNKGFPSKAVGLHTDFLFLACTLTEEELHKYRHYNRNCWTIKRSNLCRNICTFDLHPSDRIRFAQVPNATVRAERHGLKSQASTGFIAIQFALSTACKSIDLYGFDFFKTDTYYNPEGYKTLHNGDKEAEKVLEYAKYGLVKIH